MLRHLVMSDWDFRLAKNPWCLASGPNEAQALDGLLKKNSVRDTAIGQMWICLDSERSTFHRVWAITEGKHEC